MNVEELLDKELKDATRDDINKFINALRDFNVTDDKIYQCLIKDYSDEFTKDELKQLIKQAK